MVTVSVCNILVHCIAHWGNKREPFTPNISYVPGQTWTHSHTQHFIRKRHYHFSFTSYHRGVFFHFFFILVLFLFLAADVDIDPKPTVCACALCCVLDGNDHERHFSTFSFHLVLSLLLSLHNRICISYMAFIYRFFFFSSVERYAT